MMSRVSIVLRHLEKLAEGSEKELGKQLKQTKTKEDTEKQYESD
jgi:hypothetical protein